MVLYITELPLFVVSRLGNVWKGVKTNNRSTKLRGKMPFKWAMPFLRVHGTRGLAADVLLLFPSVLGLRGDL